MKPLSKDLREKMVHYMAQREMESLRDYSTRDLYELARTGFHGFEECTDLELLDEYIEVQKCCGCTEHEQDPQLRALTALLNTRSDEAEKAEVQRFIDARLALFVEPGTKPEQCQSCIEMLADINQAKREIGL